MKVRELLEEKETIEKEEKKKEVIAHIRELEGDVKEAKRNLKQEEKKLEDFLEKDFDKVSLIKRYSMFSGGTTEVRDEDDEDDEDDD